MVNHTRLLFVSNKIEKKREKQRDKDRQNNITSIVSRKQCILFKKEIECSSFPLLILLIPYA